MADIVMGEDDVAFFDELFYKQLSADEKEVFTLNSLGYYTNEIAETRGYNAQRVQRIMRSIKRKWRKFTVG